MALFKIRETFILIFSYYWCHCFVGRIKFKSSDFFVGVGNYSNATLISTSNYMLGRAILDQFSKSIFENCEITRVKLGQLQVFKIYDSDLSPKKPEPIMWLLVNLNKPASTFY